MVVSECGWVRLGLGFVYSRTASEWGWLLGLGCCIIMTNF